jgi:hypothetical protein
MLVTVKTILKSIGMAIYTAIIFIIIPYIGVQLVSNIPQVSISRNSAALLQAIITFGSILVIVAFLHGFFSGKTIVGAVMGIARSVLIACYIYYIIAGGIVGSFGVYELTFDVAQISLDISQIFTISILLAILGSIVHIIDLIQAFKPKTIEGVQIKT